MQFRPASTQIVIGFLFVLAIMIPGATPWAKEAVTAVEMQELLPGNTMSGRNQRTLEIHVYHDPNGTIKGKIKRGNAYDSGTWEVTDDNKYCRTWGIWRGRARHCFRMYRLEPNQYLLKAIHYPVDTKFEIREGDPEGLDTN